MQSLERVPGRCVMTVRLMQAPLPWLPEGATEIAPGVGLASGDDGSGTVWVHGMATFCWEAGDDASRRLAAVQLAELKAATQKQVAAGFGTDAVTVWRWADAYRRDGLAGLLPEPKGPRGPSKLTPELTAEIRELRGQGLSHASVRERCGVSSFAVRTALGTVGSRTAPAAARAGPAGPGAPPRGRGRTRQPGGPARGGRAGSRRRCRSCPIRCRGTASGRWPGSGCW